MSLTHRIINSKSEFCRLRECAENKLEDQSTASSQTKDNINLMERKMEEGEEMFLTFIDFDTEQKRKMKIME